jgi:murein L,D-transpeptidase YcbB/YkuD
MENFKFILFSFLVLVLVGGAGYWAFSTIESGSSHVDIQKQKELENKNEELIKEIVELKKQISLLQADKEALIQKPEAIEEVKTPEPVNPTPTPTKVTISKNQSLMNELQKLVDGNIYLKLKSQGVAVGTIQKFLNTYNKTSNRIDNDYGASTVTAVKNFQKAQGLTADGETGPNTYKKMITWLKSH